MRGRLVALTLLQVGVLLSWAAYHEHVWANAPTFRIPLAPRDPYDLMRGRYFVLNPLDSTIAQGGHLPEKDVARLQSGKAWIQERVLVGFCPVEAVYRVCALRRLDEAVPEGSRASYWSRGFATTGGINKDGKWEVDLDLGLRRFFIPNRLQLPGSERAEGWELEVSHRPGLAPLPRRLFFRGTAVDLR